MREVGLIKQLQMKWMPNKPLCGGRDFTTVGLIEVKPILYAYVIGVAMATGVLLIELIASRFMAYQSRRLSRQIIVKTPITFNRAENVQQLLGKWR